MTRAAVWRDTQIDSTRTSAQQGDDGSASYRCSVGVVERMPSLLSSPLLSFLSLPPLPLFPSFF
jgi:hypothetical protein